MNIGQKRPYYKLVALVKASTKRCADTAVFLCKANEDILAY